MYMLLSATVDAGKDLYKLRKLRSTATKFSIAQHKHGTIAVCGI